MNATTTLTGEMIWNALSAEPDFLEQIPEAAHPVWKDYCEAAAPAIASFSGRLLTVDNFISTKLVILKVAIEGEWMKRILSAYPEEAFPFGMKGMLVGIQGMLEALVGQLSRMEGKVGEVLVAQGVTEERFFMEPKGGRMSLDTAIKWRAGGFTIGDLAVTQPSCLFRND